jgi:hypothetical protein
MQRLHFQQHDQVGVQGHIAQSRNVVRRRLINAGPVDRFRRQDLLGAIFQNKPSAP